MTTTSRGTGPLFDVTSQHEGSAHRPWFLAALIVLVWVVIKAGLDLFLIFQRPDYFSSEREKV
jgi:hypothetical protein